MDDNDSFGRLLHSNVLASRAALACYEEEVAICLLTVEVDGYALALWLNGLLIEFYASHVVYADGSTLLQEVAVYQVAVATETLYSNVVVVVSLYVVDGGSVALLNLERRHTFVHQCESLACDDIFCAGSQVDGNGTFLVAADGSKVVVTDFLAFKFTFLNFVKFSYFEGRTFWSIVYECVNARFSWSERSCVFVYCIWIGAFFT